PLLGGTAAVVGQRGDVLDLLDVQPGLLQGGDGRLAAAAGPLDPDLDLLDAELRRLLGADLGGALGGEGGALARALEADRPRRGEAERVALAVGDGDDGVVEGRLDMGDAHAHVATLLAFLALGHVSPTSTGSREQGVGSRPSSPSSPTPYSLLPTPYRLAH